MSVEEIMDEPAGPFIEFRQKSGKIVAIVAQKSRKGRLVNLWGD